MPRIVVRYGQQPKKKGATRPTDVWEPELFPDVFPDWTWVPRDWIATDYSFEWPPGGELAIIETRFTIARFNPFDKTIPTEVVRTVEDEEVVKTYSTYFLDLEVEDGRGRVVRRPS